MFARAKGKKKKYVRQLQCQEQCINYIRCYLYRLSRSHNFPTTFLKVAVFNLRGHQKYYNFCSVPLQMIGL